MTNQIKLAISFFVLSLLLPHARAATILREDLSATKLPHGDFTLPLPGSPDAGKGIILKFSDATFHGLPPRQPSRQPGSELLTGLRTANVGDLLYPTNATFLVISGRATDLGDHYFYDLADQILTLPAEIPANADSPNSLPGTLNHLTPGHIYLVATLEGKYALVRFLREQNNGAFLQFIYQPDGTLNFPIAKSSPIALDIPLSTPDVASTQSLNVPSAPIPFDATATPLESLTLNDHPAKDFTLEPYVSSLLAQRKKLIEKRLAIVQLPARTEVEIEAKADAIEELGQLDAVEATDVLIAEIAFYNSRSRARIFTMEAFHPAVAALKRIGKPASLAAVKAIAELPATEDMMTGREEPLKTTSYRLRLLAMVIAGVEGPESAEFMLQSAQRKSPTAARPFFTQAIQQLRTP